MKRKELKNLAQKIAVYEKIVQESDDKEAIKKAQEGIMSICSHVDSLEDITIIDELVQDLLKRKNS